MNAIPQDPTSWMCMFVDYTMLCNRLVGVSISLRMLLSYSLYFALVFKGGVCLRLKQVLGRDLFNLACRHYVLELLLEAIFSALVPEVSRSPDVTIFQQFKEFWPFLDKTDYRTAEDAIRSTSRASDVLNFCQNQLHFNHLHDNYRELLELVIVFLGGVPYGCQSITFRKPGAVHQARWMAQAIYGLKMWIFLPQLSQHQQQRPSSSRVARSGILENLSDFCIFLAKHCVRAWFLARSAVSAPPSWHRHFQSSGRGRQRDRQEGRDEDAGTPSLVSVWE